MMRAFAALLLLVAFLAPTAEADWPSFHNDAKKSGSVSFSNYPLPGDKALWTNKTLANGQILASPVVLDNILVTADSVGLVRAMDAASGTEIWSFKMGQGVESTPAMSEDRVYVADKSGTLNAFTLRPPGKTGVVEHTASVGPNPSGITLSENGLFVGNGNGEVKAFFASTLTPLWTFSVSSAFEEFTTDATTGAVTCKTPLPVGAIRGAPAVYDGRVYFGSFNGFVFSVNEAGGGFEKPDGTPAPITVTKLQWMFKTGGIVVSSPAINTLSGQPDRVVFTSWDGKAYSFRAQPTGEGKNACFGLLAKPDWKYEVPDLEDPETGATEVSKIESSPAAVGARIFFGANNGKVYAVDSTKGTLLWETATNALVSSSPAVANGIVVVGSQDKHVYWLDAATGQKLKTYETRDAVHTSPAIDGDRAYVASKEGTLYNFGPKVLTFVDLTVSLVQASGQALIVRITNNGDAASNATSVRILADGTEIAQLNVTGLEPKQSADVTYTTSLAPGSYTIVAQVDFSGKIEESDNNNNELPQLVTIAGPANDPGTPNGGGDDGGGFKIPGPGLVPLLAMLGLALLAMRRRRAD